MISIHNQAEINSNSKLFGFSAFAAENPTVYAEPVISTLNEQFVLPVKIKGSMGIMGFRINIKYPESQFKLKKHFERKCYKRSVVQHHGFGLQLDQTD